jgi:drug/metabolite transporter (DMT)-like permease
MTGTGTLEKPSRLKLVLAFAAVYLIWGSTYLAIRYAIETLPPLLFASTRFLVAGGILYAWARWRGAEKPVWSNWRPSLIIGGLLLLGGNGAVVLAERTVPSGLAALLIATEPLLIVLLDWMRRGNRPSGRVSLGLALGLLGMVLLVGPTNIAGENQVNLLGAGLILVATVSWAAGSLYAMRATLVRSPALAAGMQMLAGGAWLLIAGLARGEASQFTLSNVSLRSTGALVYLILFGAIIAFTSYSWLLRVTTPSLASTYAYVNPVVAVILGWAVAGEPLTLRTIIAAAIIVAAVIIITTYKSAGRRVEEARDGVVEADDQAATARDNYAAKVAHRECLMEAGD